MNALHLHSMELRALIYRPETISSDSDRVQKRLTQNHSRLMQCQSKLPFKSYQVFRSRVPGRNGLFQSADELELIEQRIYKPPVSAAGNLRKRSKIAEKQPP